MDSKRFGRVVIFILILFRGCGKVERIDGIGG